MNMHELFSELCRLGPQAFVSLFLQSARALKKDDQIEVIQILFEKQLETARKSKTEKEILTESLRNEKLIQQRTFRPVFDDNPPSDGEKEDK